MCDRVRGVVGGLDGWVWEHPELPALRLGDLWPFAPDDIWAAGHRGLAARWDGARWTGGLPWFEGDLQAIWGARRGDLWFAGKRLVRYRDGEWAVDPLELRRDEKVLALSGSAPDDAWAVGSGFVLRWDGERWRRVDGRGGCAVWARAPDDVWVAWASYRTYDHQLSRHEGLPGGGVRRFDGRAWQEWDFGRQVLAVHGRGPDDVWAAGAGGLVRHFDGRDWRDEGPGEACDWVGVHAVGEDVWLVGPQRRDAREPVPLVFRRRDGRWGPHPGSEGSEVIAYTAVRSDPSGAIWGCGWSEVHRLDGPRPEPVGRRCLRPYGDLLAIGGRASDDLWAAGAAATLLHRDARGWHALETGWPGVIWALCARGPNDVWAVGSGGLVGRWDGRSWQRLPPLGAESLTGVVADGAGTVWVAGDRAVHRWSGSDFVRHELEGARRAERIALAVDQAGTAWAGATLWPKGGRLLRLGPAGPEPAGPDLDVPPGALWVGAPGRFWVFHARGVSVGDGRTWEEGPPGLVRVHAVVGAGPDDLWLLGHDELLQWDGRNLIRRPRPHLQLHALWRGPGCLYAVGADGAVLRLDE